MLSCSLGPLRHRFPLAPPGRVGGRKGFCSRAIPGPGLSQNPALCGSPPTKCSSALALYWCEGGISLGRSVLREYPATSTHSRFGQRGPGRAVPSLSSLPCWVVPPPKTRQSVEPPASSLSSPLQGKPPAASCFNERPEAAAPSCRAFGHGRSPFNSALPRAVPARTPEAVCAHKLPVFAGGREPGVSRPLYRQSPPSLTRRCYRPPPGPRSTRFARSAPLVVCRL